MNFALVAMVGTNNTELYINNYSNNTFSSMSNNNSINGSSFSLVENNQNHLESEVCFFINSMNLGTWMIRPLFVSNVFF